MALALRYDAQLGGVTTSAYDGYLDRLSRHSDIQEYLPLLYGWATLYPQPRILELGARRGNSTLAFLAAAQKAGGHVWSVDIDDVLKYEDGMRNWQNIPFWTFVRGDDLAAETQARVPSQVDILFVDSNHEYAHVKSELYAYMPRVAPGGVALFHDTDLETWPGRETPEIWKPVRRALDEYCKEKDMTWENIPGNWGLGVIQVGQRETDDDARDRRVQLGEHQAPRDVPAGLGQA